MFPFNIGEQNANARLWPDIWHTPVSFEAATLMQNPQPPRRSDW